MPVDKFGGSTAEKRSPCSTAVRYLEGIVAGDINMTGHRVTGLPTDLPTSDSDAASWAHVVHLVAEATTNNGTVPEGPLYQQALCRREGFFVCSQKWRYNDW